MSPAYIGRFAPSPTGSLHLGSLATALASYLDARSHNGQWLLRIDDLDTPRNVNEATSAILNCLQRFGLHWDGEVYYQSQHLDTYQALIDHLIEQEQVYPCTCSRKTLLETESLAVYPGYCRNRPALPATDYAWRVRVPNENLTFTDRLQGVVCHNLARQHGDFIIKRKDHIIAYQFAVVIDDHLQQVNHVVRGIDLLDSTPKQQYLHTLLDYPLPTYAHIPVIVDRHGQKLSKQSLAKAVDDEPPVPVLFLLLTWLGQQPPAELLTASVAELLTWAIQHWQIEALANLQTLTAPQSAED